MSNARISYLDAVRGFLILLVVLGHSSFPYSEYLYWFHMSSFFLLSGVVMSINGKSWGAVLQSNLGKLGLSYITSAFLIFCAGLVVRMTKLEDFPSFLLDLALGGTYLRWAHGVLWFVTTMIISRIIFYLCERTFYSPSLKAFIYLIMYLSSHLLTHGTLPQSMINDPWFAPRYFLLGVPLLALGFYVKSIIGDITTVKKYVVPNILVILIIIFMQYFHLINYQFNMKYGIDTLPIVDLAMPLSVVIILAYLFSRFNCTFLEKLGKHSLTIMYWHVLVGVTISHFFENNWVIYTLSGTLIPLVGNILIQKIASKQLPA